MKRILFSLMMVVATTATSFAQGDNRQVNNAAKAVAEQVKSAPSGTVYGVVENTKRHVVVATPIGRYTIEKNNDGSVSCMGMTAKLISAKNGIYKVKSSLGTFTVNANTGKITKN